MPSRASVTTPTWGPNSRTEAKPNASETENLASIEGTLSVSIPLAIVRAANRIHSCGVLDRTSASVL